MFWTPQTPKYDILERRTPILKCKKYLCSFLCKIYTMKNKYYKCIWNLKWKTLRLHVLHILKYYIILCVYMCVRVSESLGNWIAILLVYFGAVYMYLFYYINVNLLSFLNLVAIPCDSQTPVFKISCYSTCLRQICTIFVFIFLCICSGKINWRFISLTTSYGAHLEQYVI